MSQQKQQGDVKKLLQAPCAEEYTASLKCKASMQLVFFCVSDTGHCIVTTL